MPLSDQDQVLALRALAFIAADERLFPRFLALSGVTGAELRAGAQSGPIQGAVLDFLAANEADLLACAAALNVPPERLARRDPEAGRCGR